MLYYYDSTEAAKLQMKKQLQNVTKSDIGITTKNSHPPKMRAGILFDFDLQANYLLAS